MTNTYADNVLAYAQAGWSCILPVPPETKSPPPVGFTGAAGRDTDPVTLVQWSAEYRDHSIALRMPDGVVGIDVDHYTKGEVVKNGDGQLAAHADTWGPLPATWCSTARGSQVGLDESAQGGPGPSRIMFYRVPAGKYRTSLGDSIEIIQRHHRYAVVAPSTHEVGTPYRWYDPSGSPAEPGVVPKPHELPELPAAWVEGLREGAAAASVEAADFGSGERLLAEIEADDREPCADVFDAAESARHELNESDEGGRHDVMTPGLYRLVMLGAAGHAGVGPVLAELRELWEQRTAGEERTAEFERALLGAARKAVTVSGQRQVRIDPCETFGGVLIAAPAPSGVDEDGEPIDTPVLWSVRSLIGVHAFDPPYDLDQPLAEEVMRRMFPALRYATDANSWLIAGPFTWRHARDLASWAVAQVAWLMPHGDPNGDKDSDEFRRAKRRARLNDNAGATKVAGKLKALVASEHPAAVELADLDTDPEIVWAGGVAWNLRASLTAPVRAPIHPGTPHMHSAAVAPQAGVTPLWDAFTAAVWPDEEVRAWALRVLSIALTGYADAALPVLLGPTGRGKSQVVELIMSVLGSYAHAANPKLLASETSSHDSIVFALKGRRLSFIDEAPRTGDRQQERLKQLTGGTHLTGNAMRKDPVTFKPTHTLILTANDEPRLTDPAVRRRVRLIPCEGDPEIVRATRAAIGDTHGSVWRAEAPGVLAALMREAAGWLADRESGTTEAGPDSVRFRAEEIATEQDPIAVWLAEDVIPDADGTRSRALYERFVSWCRSGNMHAAAIPSETRWGRELTARGFPSEARRDGKYRALRVRLDGMWVIPTSPPPFTTAADGDGSTAESSPGVPGSVTGVTGRGGLKIEPVTGQTRMSGPVLSDCVTGVNSSYRCPPSPTHTHTHKAVETEDSSNPSHEDHKTAPDLRCDGLTGSSGVSDSETPEPENPPKGSRTARAQAKAAEKAAAKAEAKRQAIAEAAGELIELPAACNRAGRILAVSLVDAEAFVRTTIARSGQLTVDVETTGFPIGHPEYALRSIQLGDADLAVDFDADDPAQVEVCRRLIEAAPVLHAHSAVADLAPLDHAGAIDPESAWARMADTVIPAKLGDPASTGSDPDLKKLAGNVLGTRAVAPVADAARKALFAVAGWLTDTKPDTPVERSGWTQVDKRCSTMVRYAASDVLDTAALAAELPAIPPHLLDRESRAQRMTARVSHRGVLLDVNRVRALRAEHEQKRAEQLALVHEFGIENPGSNPQVAARLTALGANLPRTKPSVKFPDGQPSVGKDTLDELVHETGEVGELSRTLLAYRHHAKAISAFLEPWRQLGEGGDGRVRPTIYTLAADTGRMSCVRPNLQQVPRQGGMRSCILADPGYRLISADFAGVEIRVAAALSGDPTLMQVIAAHDADPKGHPDVHTMIARQVWGPNATKEHRYIAKRGVFANLYGAGVTKIAKTLGITHAQAQAVIDTLFGIAPTLAQWSQALVAEAKSGRLRTFPSYSGRAIHLPRQSAYAAVNYVIQGTARELLIDGLDRWEATPWGEATVLPIHDEIVAFVSEDDAEAATAALVAAMTTTLNGVAIEVEAAAPSTFWKDAS